MEEMEFKVIMGIGLTEGAEEGPMEKVEMEDKLEYMEVEEEAMLLEVEEFALYSIGKKHNVQKIIS